MQTPFSLDLFLLGFFFPQWYRCIQMNTSEVLTMHMGMNFLTDKPSEAVTGHTHPTSFHWQEVVMALSSAGHSPQERGTIP